MNQVAAKGYITDKSSIDQAFRTSRFVGYENAYEGIKITEGRYLSYDGKRAKAYYSHSNGGRTYSSKEVWGGADYAYLQAKSDPYDNEKKNGHGVGLSQTGAIQMAKQGKTYQEILDFYFPGTQIQSSEANTMTSKEQTIVQ